MELLCAAKTEADPEEAIESDKSNIESKSISMEPLFRVLLRERKGELVDEVSGLSLQEETVHVLADASPGYST